MKRVERLHAISELLRRSGTRGLTAQQLATEFGVSVRTVKRDLDALENSGAPLWAKPGPHGGYGLTLQTNLPPVSLSPAQAVAVLAAVSAAPDAPFSDQAAVAVRKIVAVLDPPTQRKVDELAQRIWVNTEDGGSRAVRSTLETALLEQRVTRIHYEDRNSEVTQRSIEPIIFASTQGHWYLIAWCQLREGIRWFKCNRIQRATVTGAPCSGHEVAEIGIAPVTSRSVAVRQGQ